MTPPFMSSNSHSRVPPGFRFHPTDEELVGYYLQKKVAAKKIDLDVIHDIDLYKLEPWDLHERCKIGSAEQSEWYFFSHKDKKYPTGTRTNRATTAGFWKATGRDKAIHTKYKLIGMRKTLVFYKGRAPNGQKTDWIMHEYRLEDENSSSNNNNDDGWVVCRVFKKRNSHNSNKLLDRDNSRYEEQIALLPELESPGKFPADISVYTHSSSLISCKQEFEPENNYVVLRDPFSGLPQLESPKLTSHHHHHHLSNSLKGLTSSLMLRHSPPHFSLDPPTTTTTSSIIYQSQQEQQQQQQQQQQRHHQLSCFSNEPVTDWRMIDRMAAAQLSHEEISSTKDMMMRYNHNNVSAAATTGADSSSADEDVALLLRLTKQHNASSSSSSSCDMDLWNLARPVL